MPRHYPAVEITADMIAAAEDVASAIRVLRTQASPIDTLAGALGEYAFAQYFYGDWRRNRVGANKGQSDFDGIEIKTSAFPFDENRLHLLVREDYGRKRKPPFYVQIILDVADGHALSIPAGTMAFICGYATGDEVAAAPLRDFGAKSGAPGGYRCFYIPISQLHPVEELRLLRR